MSLRPQQIDSAWKKVGMEVFGGTNHIRATLRVSGKVILTTTRSRGSKTMEGNIPQFIRQQMRLSSADFDDLINCPLNRDGYIKLLKGMKIVASKPSTAGSAKSDRSGTPSKKNTPKRRKQSRKRK